MKENILFEPKKIFMECEYFQVKNSIFDEKFTVKSIKVYKKNGELIKGKKILEYRNLDCYEMLVYIYLCRCANNNENAFPSYATIGTKVNCSRRKAIDCIKVLSDNGFIYKKRSFNAKGENESNVYYINTELKKLKSKLDTLYPIKEKKIIETPQNEDSIAGTLPSVAGTPLDSVAGTLPSVAGTPKKEQCKKNNIKKEQYNNKIDFSVVDEDILNLKSFINNNLHSCKLSDKEFTTIAHVLKNKYGEINFEVIATICDIVKKSKTINNLGGFIVNAIKEDYQQVTYKSNNLKFNNFQERKYNYDKLEEKLLEAGRTITHIEKKEEKEIKEDIINENEIKEIKEIKEDIINENEIKEIKEIKEDIINENEIDLVSLSLKKYFVEYKFSEDEIISITRALKNKFDFVKATFLGEIKNKININVTEIINYIQQ